MAWEKNCTLQIFSCFISVLQYLKNLNKGESRVKRLIQNDGLPRYMAIPVS